MYKCETAEIHVLKTTQFEYFGNPGLG